MSYSALNQPFMGLASRPDAGSAERLLREPLLPPVPPGVVAAIMLTSTALEANAAMTSWYLILFPLFRLWSKRIAGSKAKDRKFDAGRQGRPACTGLPDFALHHLECREVKAKPVDHTFDCASSCEVEE